MANEQELGDDFSYMLRMADTDIDGLRPLRTALTAVRGVGDRTAANICRITGFDPSMKAGHLDTAQQETLREAIENYAQNVPLWMLNRQRDLESGDELHLSGQDLKLTHEDDISSSWNQVLPWSTPCWRPQSTWTARPFQRSFWSDSWSTAKEVIGGIRYGTSKICST